MLRPNRHGHDAAKEGAMVPIRCSWKSWTVFIGVRGRLRRLGCPALVASLLLWPGVAAAQSTIAGAIIPGLRTTGPNMGGTRRSTVVETYLMARGRANSANTMELDGMDVRSSRGDGQQAQTNFAMAQEVTYQINAISADASGGGVRIMMIPR